MHTYTESEVDTLAARLLAEIKKADHGATVLGLSGDLGAGKTTLTKAIARQLGISDDVQSPTFVILKSYEPTQGDFRKLAHMDAYRIESLDELAPLRFGELLQEPNTLLIIEWPERIEGALPPHVVRFVLEHDNDRRVLRYA